MNLIKYIHQIHTNRFKVISVVSSYIVYDGFRGTPSCYLLHTATRSFQHSTRTDWHSKYQLGVSLIPRASSVRKNIQIE